MRERRPGGPDRTPQMGERRRRGPPDGDIPPHMRERRPMDPEGRPLDQEGRPIETSEGRFMGPEGERDRDIPPHMRERRSMRPGPEGDREKDRRDRRPSPGPISGPERTPQMGERRLRGSERTPRMGPERTPRMGPDRTPRMGPDRTPRMGPDRTPRMGPDRTPQMEERRLRSPSDPNRIRMSRSCSPSPNRRRPRPPPNGPNVLNNLNGNGDIPSPHLSFRNSPRPNMISSHDMNSRDIGSPARKPIELSNSPNSSLGRSPNGMMHKPMNSPMNISSPFRVQHSASGSPISPMILPEGIHQSNTLGINNIERKLSSNSSRSMTDSKNGSFNHRRNASVSSSLSTHSTSSDRPPKSAYRKPGLQSPNHHNSNLIETSKTPLIVNNVGELNAHSAAIQTVNEFGEVEDVKSYGSQNQSKNASPAVDIDFNQLLNSLDNTLQNKSNNFTVRSNASTPSGSRRNSELEKIRADRRSKFEDMEKYLDNTIQNNQIKSKSNATPSGKANNKTNESHYDDSNLKNLLDELTMASNTENRN
jgi:hypothetical protein